MLRRVEQSSFLCTQQKLGDEMRIGIMNARGPFLIWVFSECFLLLVAHVKCALLWLGFWNAQSLKVKQLIFYSLEKGENEKTNG